MSHIDDLARESVHTLVSNGLSRSQFNRWRDGVSPDIATVLGDYVFGEIVWLKKLGKPNSTKLSDGYTMEAWWDQMRLIGDVNGDAYWDPLHIDCPVSLWDGPADAEHYRVSFMVSGLKAGASSDGLTEHSTYSHIVPHFKRGVSWTTDGSKLSLVPVGLRTLEPPRAAFVKPRGLMHLSFEVTLMRPTLLP